MAAELGLRGDLGPVSLFCALVPAAASLSDAESASVASLLDAESASAASLSDAESASAASLLAAESASFERRRSPLRNGCLWLVTVSGDLRMPAEPGCRCF